MSWIDPRTWLAGEKPTAALLNLHLRNNLKAIGDPWIAYTPVWAATGTAISLGNGTVTGLYMQAGKLVWGTFFITSGTTTTYGTGNYSITLPVTAKNIFPLPIGDLIGLSSGSVYHEGALHGTGLNTAASGSFAGARWSATGPFTPGAGAVNRYAGSFLYEAA
jgi:hypothetical protein